MNVTIAPALDTTTSSIICDREASPENRENIQAIASQELIQHVETQANTIAPEISAIVPKLISVERIGVTRNSSSTPYLVYVIEKRRHCTFFKRKLLWQLLQVFLKTYHNVEETIRSVISTDSDLKVMLGGTWQTLFKPHVTKFVERLNNRNFVAAMPLVQSLQGYTLGARSAKACARNYKIIEMQRYREKASPTAVEFDTKEDCQPSNHSNTSVQPADISRGAVEDEVSLPPVEVLVKAMKKAIANWSWEILAEALYGKEQHKAAAWKQLTPTEREQLTQLTPPQVRMLAQARREGRIAAFVEHSSGGIFSVWTTMDGEVQTLTSTAVAGFIQDLV